ncbi:flagellar filament capping protein FliD [Grimontia sp. NTOU-MAR1]|uniref:flagellar filament capping protein FliD n=1 Tax=Grimontia sp. NTOU-MAR1 TaxID=3111011 RepID=UPI002DBFF0E8|nr:flagellar filament capping protein FliD [Grimontia sp. NTOU-MAR1]WRV98734.1 flagellar filament capping protein FliD [Grimontia sp. NTOU-MAR1]
MSSLDPITMATQLATFDVQPFQMRYQMQADKYQAQIAALGKVDSALRDFRNAVNDMNSTGSSIIKNTATTTQDGFFSASADANALSGSYQIFVEQIASAHQASAGMPADMDANTEIPTTGELTFTVNGEQMVIDLSTVDTDGDGKATMGDLVKAINNSTNPGVNATPVRSNGQTHLMLSSTETGAANRVEVSATGTGATWFEDGFANLNTITEPKDAVIWLGAQNSGLKLTNASNTFEGVIDGVDITVTKAQTTGDAAIGLNVGVDAESTKEQANKFIEAYNTLITTLDEHTALGGEDQKRGALANDPTLRSIESQLSGTLRSDFNGMRLADVGISINREGKMELYNDKFTEAQKNNSAALEQMFNGKGNLLDSIDSMMEPYLKFSSGLLSSRKESLQSNIDRIDDKQAQLERKYDMAYDRYLKQFTQMNNIMTQMNQTMSMFG